MNLIIIKFAYYFLLVIKKVLKDIELYILKKIKIHFNKFTYNPLKNNN